MTLPVSPVRAVAYSHSERGCFYDAARYFGWQSDYLLGVLHSGPQFTARGTITFANLPNAPTPAINVPMNLGVAVKATEILKFEPVLNKMNGGHPQ